MDIMNPEKGANIIGIRHAESEFNLAQAKANNFTDFDVFKKDNLDLLYSKDFIDCPITEKGMQQCLETRLKLSLLPISKVIVSPLQRALQTANYLFQDHPSKPEIIVDPIIREMILSADDVGGLLEDSLTTYSHFNFQQLLENPKISQVISVIDILILRHQTCGHQRHVLMRVNIIWHLNIFNRSQLVQRTQNTVQQYEDGPKLLVEYLRSIYPENLENFQDTKQRMVKARDRLKMYASEVKENQVMAIVTHYVCLLNLSANIFDNQGFPLDGKKWINCEFQNIQL